jgi:light-harvesting complex II chlorophyll a/b binding protein 4
MAAIASLNVFAAVGAKKVAKKAPVKRAAGGKRSGNIGPNRTLWNGWEANPEPPAYLDGTLPGDAGFDPLGLSKPTEYLQFDLDQLDGSAAVNKIGGVIGKLKKVDNKPTERTIVVSV